MHLCIKDYFSVIISLSINREFVMLKKINVLALAMLSMSAVASDYTQKDQSKKINEAIQHNSNNKPLLACQAYAEAEEMGYLGDQDKITDPNHNQLYSIAALELAKCLDEQPVFAKQYDNDEMNSLIVYTTLNDIYRNKAAKAFLDKEMAMLAESATVIKNMDNNEIVNGSKSASLACVAAQTAYNSIGFTGLPSERKKGKLNRNYVNTGMVYALCNVFHPYYTKSSSRFVALNEAKRILTDLSENYGSSEANKMLSKVQPMLDAETAKRTGHLNR